MGTTGTGRTRTETAFMCTATGCYANGHATNGHATNGHATNGHATNGHLNGVNGHASMGTNGTNGVNGRRRGQRRTVSLQDVGGAQRLPQRRDGRGAQRLLRPHRRHARRSAGGSALARRWRSNPTSLYLCLRQAGARRDHRRRQASWSSRRCSWRSRRWLKLSSRGPVFYKSSAGPPGAAVAFYEFRSMYVGAHEDRHEGRPPEREERRSGLQDLLRPAHHADRTLPAPDVARRAAAAGLNVLRGDMTLVGPGRRCPKRWPEVREAGIAAVSR